MVLSCLPKPIILASFLPAMFLLLGCGQAPGASSEASGAPPSIASEQSGGCSCTNQPSSEAQTKANEGAVSVDGDTGYTVTEIGGGLYWVTDGNSTMAIAVGSRDVAVMDAPPSLTGRLGEIVATVTDRPITYAIYSHAHADHIGGFADIPTSVRVVATSGAAEELSTIMSPAHEIPFGKYHDAGKPVPTPTLLIKDSLRLDLGGLPIYLEALPVGHSRGDLLAYFAEQQTIMAVDFTWPGSVPWIRLGEAINVPGLMKANERLLDFDFNTLIAGHINQNANREDVTNTLGYLTDLKASAESALQSIQVADIAQETGKRNAYELMDVYFDRLNCETSGPVTEKWGDILQGAGIWTCDHAQRMITSLRMDEAMPTS